MDDVIQMLIVFGAIAAVLLAPVYWRHQTRKRVLDAVQDMAKAGTPMSTDLVITLMSPGPQQEVIPTRQRDIRRGIILLSLAVGFALIGLAAFVIATHTGGDKEAAAVAAGVTAIGAIPAALGLAFLALGMSQKKAA